jgi:hypothetical protein
MEDANLARSGEEADLVRPVRQDRVVHRLQSDRFYKGMDGKNPYNLYHFFVECIAEEGITQDNMSPALAEVYCALYQDCVNCIQLARREDVNQDPADDSWWGKLKVPTTEGLNNNFESLKIESNPTTQTNIDE